MQVLSTPEARSSQGLGRVRAQVTPIAPDAGGAAVTIQATSKTIVNAFRNAAVIAVVSITIILLLALRRVLDVALVLAPLLLSALLTLLVAVLLPLPLNFANIIALPLLLGVGVSFNIYFVMNWRAGRRRSSDRQPRGPSYSRRSPPEQRLVHWHCRRTREPRPWANCC